MPRVRCSVTIDCPVGKVFRFVADPASAKRWQPDVVEVYNADEPLRIGAIVSQDRSTQLFNWRLDLNVDIMEYEPNRLIEYVGALGRFPVKGRLEFESVRRTAVVTETINIRTGIFLALFSPFLKSVMQRRTRVALETLKAVLESGEAEIMSSSDT